ncbi:MAG: sugar ABC transporter permease [Anaerolineae bacterium]|jgi:glucose/mannose transport system permease protein
MRSISRDRLSAILMLLPSVILLAIFVYGFIGRTTYDSMTDWEGVGEKLDINFIGSDNYDKLFTGLLDVRFRQSLVNTFFFTAFFMLGCLALGMFLAMLIDQGVRYEGVFRIIFLFPMSLSFIVTGTVWRWLFNPKGGINRLPALIGLEPLKIRWLTDREQLWQFNWQDTPKMAAVAVIVALALVVWRYWRRGRKWVPAVAGGLAIVVLAWVLLGGPDAIQTTEYEETHGFNMALVGLVIAAVWQMSGYTMAMYLAGIRGIPEELREAARVDGANEFQVYRRIILPMLQPITLSAMIVLGHISLKIFDLVFVMAGPDNATTDVPGTLMFTTAFRANQFAKGAGIAVVMLVMVAVVIVPYLIVTLRSETEL